MESLSLFNTTPFSATPQHFFPSSRPRIHIFQTKSTPPSSSTNPRAMKSPRGFGPVPNKTKNRNKNTKRSSEEDDDDDDDDYEEYERESDVAIPEVVTNRMMTRMGLSVGIPLSVGLLFFPFFYYLKVIAKIDVPTWIPFIVSFIFFGTALLGVSYGIVSASWDPIREGSLLGWNEARRNWPVFLDSLWGARGGGSKK